MKIDLIILILEKMDFKGKIIVGDKMIVIYWIRNIFLKVMIILN